MFVRCPHCRTLVLTDQQTGEIPEFCPHCHQPLETVRQSSPQKSSTSPAPPSVLPLTNLLKTHDVGTPVQTDSATDKSDISSSLRVDKTQSANSLRSDADNASTAPSSAIMHRDVPDVERTTEDADDKDQIARVVAAFQQRRDLSELKAGNRASPIESSVKPATDTGTDNTSKGAEGMPAPTVRRAPSFIQGVPEVLMEENTSPRKRWIAIAALVVLSVTLFFQLLMSDRERLAAHADSRPMITKVCAALGCDIPLWREPAAFTLIARDVRPHPAQQGVLHISATFRNEARWTQAWPVVRVKLTDINGATVAMRDFLPRDYLSSDHQNNGIDPGQSANISMDVIDPSLHSIAFDFQFR